MAEEQLVPIGLPDLPQGNSKIQLVDNASSSLSKGSDPSSHEDTSREGTPPPLPPRAKRVFDLHNDAPPGTQRTTSSSTRPSLSSKATTALSSVDIHSESHLDPRTLPSSRHGSNDFGDTASIRSVKSTRSSWSVAPTLEAEDVESLLGDVLAGRENTTWKLLESHGMSASADELFQEDANFEKAFKEEFEELEEMKSDGSNGDAVIKQWNSKLKHFLILSSAGKPIWSRHGDGQLIASNIGVIQTIISFYQSTNDVLKSFTAGDVRFVIISKGYLNLVAISRLGESDSQLRIQLEALYMQILSTLTLPNMERMFSNRPSTDLRRPLQGTEMLLSALADGFTRGSPSTLLSALECLRMRKAHRTTINNTFLKSRSSSLLYGLIVAGGRLVSVVRPKKHSLHPGDLQLIFNMLFEAGSVKAGGGENWIPLCLPGFNNTGYLYMYVSFLNLDKFSEDVTERPSTSSGEEEVAIILISANKEGFFDLQDMRHELVEQLRKNGSLEVIRQAVQRGRPSCTDILPGSVLRHFLYKSKNNVQFAMPSYEPSFETEIEKRRLHTLYSHLHATLHTKPTHPKIHHAITPTHISLAWSAPTFELYAVAPAHTPRTALAQAASRLVSWVRKEENRLFLIGGAVF
ncbi:DUF254-domain-containing protein [Eremomyces bilateralis CBS 781.70]|uniref:Vacuolar fusion protein MON1 n=1 Tax=Eremomyces bilateralis CBS 781.70 TaxID=1392243 RepID=A0A6G1FYB0_9PEZI|nr:DUF254-domain-containing protein [Eremomyces bilateralis CBS 781.70]KAF1810559.1 DUF254-domain-containing protein [Eremomyces bilateralis CBS 781.70]